VVGVREFARLARKNGHFVIITPHPRRVEVPGARRRKHVWESTEAAYLRCEIAAEAARYADAYETQAQYLQRDPGRYAEFVSKTAAQAREANPDVVMLSGLSTHPGYRAKPAVLD